MRLVTIDGLCLASNLSLAQFRKISRKNKDIVIGVTHVLLPDYPHIEPSIPSKSEIDNRLENFESQKITPNIHVPPKTTPPTAQHIAPKKPFLSENGEILPAIPDYPPRLAISPQTDDTAKNIARADYLKTLPRSPHRIETDESPRKTLKQILSQPDPDAERKNYESLRSKWPEESRIAPLEPKEKPSYDPYLGLL